MRATGGSARHGSRQRKKSLGSVECTLEQKRAVIAMLAQEYPVSVVCEIVECARSSYYHRPLPAPDAGLLHAILRGGSRVATVWLSARDAPIAA